MTESSSVLIFLDVHSLFMVKKEQENLGNYRVMARFWCTIKHQHSQQGADAMVLHQTISRQTTTKGVDTQKYNNFENQ